MDKKQAEEEAMSKAKEAQSAAGKSSGMSGRDLVRVLNHPNTMYVCRDADLISRPSVPIQPRVVRRRGGGGRGLGFGQVQKREGGGRFGCGRGSYCCPVLGIIASSTGGPIIIIGVISIPAYYLKFCILIPLLASSL
jgi:hypothetical protein